jgi:hypothetical protein
MLSSGLVVVSLLLATHGDEGTREEKFRGALVAQNAAPVNDTAAIQREIDLLTIERPSTTGPKVLIGVGFGTAAAAGAVLLGIVFGAATGWGIVLVAAIAVVAAAVGIVLGVIGLISLGIASNEREKTDLGLEKLRQQLKATPSPAAVPSVQREQPLSPLVLARF